MDHIHDQLGKYRIGSIFDNLPDMVKSAEDKIVSEDLSKLADSLFAYSDGINRYFPIHTPEHLYFSRVYFEKCADTLEDKVRHDISIRIEDAWKFHELPELTITKEASHEDEIDAIHHLAIALHEFMNNYKKLPIHQRREKAKELAHHAFSLGKQHGLSEIIKRYAGNTLRKDHGEAFAKRMQFFRHGSNEKNMLMRMQEETPKVNPEHAAKALSIFDERSGLNHMYDNELEDPYLGLLSGEEQAEETLDFEGHKVFPSKLKNFCYDGLKEELDEELINNLKSNPIETLNKLNPHVRIIVIKHVNHG